MKASSLLPAALIVGSLAYGAGAIAGTYGGTFGNGGTPSAAGGGGSGDITSVGDCTTGACLASGNTNLTGANFTDNVGIGVTNGNPARSLDLRGDSTRNAVVSTFSATDNSRLSLVRARGTQASPTVAQSGDTLGQLFFRGQLSTTIDVFGGDTGIYGVATENMSSTNRGSRMDFYATPNGSSTAVLQMTTSESGVIVNDTGLAASDFRVEGDTEANLIFCDASADTCGIGNSAPNFRLSTNLTTSATNNVQSSFQLKTTSTGDMLDGFGGGMLWAIQDTAAVENNIAGISGIRDGADNSGKLVFRTFLTGSSNNRMTLLSTGELGIGDETPDAFLDVAGTLRADGQATFVADPSSTGASNASVYVNPATSATNEVLLACADNGTSVFSVDKEGDMDVRTIGNAGSGTCDSLVAGSVCVLDSAGSVVSTGGTAAVSPLVVVAPAVSAAADPGFTQLYNEMSTAWFAVRNATSGAGAAGTALATRSGGGSTFAGLTAIGGIDSAQDTGSTQILQLDARREAGTYLSPSGSAITTRPLLGVTNAGTLVFGVHVNGTHGESSITPTALAANTDNYAGCTSTKVCRIGMGGGSYNLTGLVPSYTATLSERRTLCNVDSTGTLTLVDDATSTAANRFQLNANFAIVPERCVDIQYDLTSSRWRLVGGG